MQRLIATLCALALAIHSIDACTSKPPSPDPGPAPTPSPGEDETGLTRYLGDDVEAGKMESLSDDSGSPSLNCDFESACCWNNAPPPDDDYDYLTITDGSKVDDQKLKDNFGTDLPLFGKFAAVGGNGASTRALLTSCPIACSQETLLVTLSHYTSQGVAVSVCTKSADSDQLENCQVVPKADSPGPSLVELPGGENMQVVIMADGFPASGGMALIDDLLVDYVPCDAGAETTTSGSGGGAAAGGDAAACSLACDGESLCAFETDGDMTANSEKWAARDKAWYKNRVTGVPRHIDGGAYLATYLEGKENQESNLRGDLDAPLSEETSFAFDYYEATDLLSLMGCCDDDCTFSSDEAITTNDRQWKSGLLTCPAGTSQVSFRCRNDDGNEGGCGLKNVDVVKGDGSSLC